MESVTYKPGRRVYTCSCGREWCWDSRDGYGLIIHVATDFLQHRWRSQPADDCHVPRRADELQAFSDIHWATGHVSAIENENLQPA